MTTHHRRRARGAVLAAFLMATAGCSLLGFGGRPRETPEQIAAFEAEDARIRRDVEARLAAEPAVQGSQIRVEVRRAEVSLHGGARGFGALQCAIRNAELVRGVRLVIDLMVLEAGPSTVQCRAPRTLPAATSSARSVDPAPIG